ncbi:helix-turn-helix domain-containing protein, partial [Candidatus Curtissbacteria bacterium]|nr:helix-turn-helix domain-containing protein [Candidatus Curtissbacteria bacterium]
MRSIPAELKLALIKRALSGEKVARLCREIGVARKTFYSWLKKYNNSKPNVAKIKLRDRRFAKRFSFKTLYPKERLLLISKYLNHEASVATLCRQFGVSRKTFYKWFVRYQSKGENALYDARVRGQAHPKAVTPQRQQEVLNYVAWNPSYSVHKLNSQLDFIGHHGIQNLLSREGLNTYERRLAYARASQESGVRVKVAPTYVPEIPAYRWRMLFAPFKTVPKLLLARPIRLDSARLVAGILTTLSIFLPLSLIFLWLSSIVGAPQESSTVGLIFASVALFFGLFFFLYSMKYYLTILMVLRLAQGGGATSEGKESRGSQGSRESGESRGLGGQISRIFSKLGIGKFLHFRGVFGQRAYRVNPLLVNLEKVKLEAGSRPFVSIHVAVYNEKKVVERLIAACTSQEWSRDSRVDDGRLKVDLEAGGSKVDNPESNFYPQDPSSSFHPPSSIANY